MEIYKRIAGLRTAEDRADVIDELIDRFGDLPDSVTTLLDVSFVRAMCVRLGISVVTRNTSGILMRFDVRYIPDLNALSAAMGPDSPLRFASARVPGLVLPLNVRQKDEDALKILAATLNTLVSTMDAQKM